MGSPKGKSAKRSGTKKKRPPKYTFFFDRSSGTAIENSFKRAKQVTVLHDSLFAPNTPDVQWIAECGKRRYFAVTGDRNIQQNHNERNALIAARIGAFAFSNGNWNTQQKEEAVTKGMKRILKLCQSQKKPFIAQISKNGQVKIWYDQNGVNLLSNARLKRKR